MHPVSNEALFHAYFIDRNCDGGLKLTPHGEVMKERWMTGSRRSYQYFMTVSEDGKNGTKIVRMRMDVFIRCPPCTHDISGCM